MTSDVTQLLLDLQIERRQVWKDLAERLARLAAAGHGGELHLGVPVQNAGRFRAHIASDVDNTYAYHDMASIREYVSV